MISQQGQEVLNLFTNATFLTTRNVACQLSLNDTAASMRLRRLAAAGFINKVDRFKYVVASNPPKSKPIKKKMIVSKELYNKTIAATANLIADKYEQDYGYDFKVTRRGRIQIREQLFDFARGNLNWEDIETNILT